MIYIWNRAHRVSKDLMPQRIIECFSEWKEAQEEKLKLIPDPTLAPLPTDLAKKFSSQRYRIKNLIKKQSANLQTAIRKFKNENE